MSIRLAVFIAALLFAPALAHAQVCPSGSTCNGFAAMMGGTGAATTPGSGDFIPLIQGGATKHVTGDYYSNTIQGRAISSTAPNPGNNYAWNGTNWGPVAGPSVANLTALRASCTGTSGCPAGDPVFTVGVWRQTDGVAGAPPLYFGVGSGACGTDDGASCVNSADSNHWIGQFPTAEYDVRQFGADPSGATDATTALNHCLAAAGAGRKCYTGSTKLLVLGNVTIPAFTALDCGSTMADDQDVWTAYSTLPGIRLDGGHTISASGPSAAIHACLIYRNGMTFPVVDASAFTGTAVSAGGNNSFSVTKSVILGFDTDINVYGTKRANIQYDYLDGSGVTNAALYGGNGADVGTFAHLKIYWFAGGTGGSPAGCGIVRPGIGFELNIDQAEYIGDIIVAGFQTANFDFVGGTSVQQHYIGWLWSDFPWNIGCARGSSVGIKVTTNPIGTQSFLHFNSIITDGSQTGMTIDGLASTSDTTIDYLYFGASGADGLDLGSATPTHAGHVKIGSLVGSGPGYAIKIADTSVNTWLDVSGGKLTGVNGGAAPYIAFGGAVISNQVNVSRSVITDLSDPTAIYGARSITGCTGVGTGSCGFTSSEVATPLVGVITISPTGSPSSSGAVTVALPVGWDHTDGCVLGLRVGSGTWPAATSVPTVSGITSSSFAVNWNAGTALTAGLQYRIGYNCVPQ